MSVLNNITMKIYNKYLVWRGAAAWAFWPFIFYKSKNHATLRRTNHEKIHHAQQLEMLLIPFYILYGIYHLKYGYRDNPFEEEAFANDTNLDYLKTRKKYSWKKYI